VLLINASGAKQFGMFPSQVDEKQCEDGAHAAFVEMCASPQVYSRFSSLDRNKERGMSFDQAKAAVRDLKTNPIFISPSLIGQEFRKVITGTSTPRVSPRTRESAASATRINVEQFRAMMDAISKRIGPRLLLRNVCLSLAAHTEGPTVEPLNRARAFDNGAPNAPHRPNPRAFLRSSRPCSAPRGLRAAAIPEAVQKAEQFLKPTPPKWRPSGPVDSKTMARAVATLTPSSMLGDTHVGDAHSMIGAKDGFFDGEEADLERLHQDQLLAHSSSRIRQSTSNSAPGHPNQMQPPQRSLQRMEQKARKDYARMLNMNNEVSLHQSICSWMERSQTQADSVQEDHVELCFPGGHMIRAGKKERPQHLVPTAPSGQSRQLFARGHKRLCPAPVYETAPVLNGHDSVAKPASPGRGEKKLREAHIMADKAASHARYVVMSSSFHCIHLPLSHPLRAIMHTRTSDHLSVLNSSAAKKRMASRLGGVQPHFEGGNWYMRSPSIHATSYAGAMSQPLAQVLSRSKTNTWASVGSHLHAGLRVGVACRGM